MRDIYIFENIISGLSSSDSFLAGRVCNCAYEKYEQMVSKDDSYVNQGLGICILHSNLWYKYVP